MEYTKLILTLCVFLSSLAAKAATSSFGGSAESFARGLMIAVDTRDHRACESTKNYVRLLIPFFNEDLCAQDGNNPLSVVVVTYNTTEWDFMSEVELSRKAPVSARDHNVGFVRGDRAGLLFLLPAARESDHHIRLSLKREQLSVAHVRMADLRMLKGLTSSNMSVPFLLMRREIVPNESEQEATERMVRRVRISRSHPSSSQQDSSDALSSLNIVDGLNGSSATEEAGRFEIDFFIPKDECTERPGGQERCEKGRWWLPSGIGFSFKIFF